MTRVRGSLGRIAIAWLLCQAATLALAPTILWPHSASALECQCTHGEHAICPMHHRPAPGSKLCLMRSAADDGTAVLTSLFGAVVLPASNVASAPAEPPAAVAVMDAATLLIRPASPDPPPPRL